MLLGGNTLLQRSHFCLALCSFGLTSCALVVITWRGVGRCYIMQLGSPVKRAQPLNTKPQMSSVWAKGCMYVDDYVCFI